MLVLALVALRTAPAVAGRIEPRAEREDGGAGSSTSAPLVVGSVTFELDDVFTEEELGEVTGLEAFLRRQVNALHVNTRRYVIRRELLFAPGDPLEPSVLEETARNLRELGILSNIAIAPVDTLEDGTVDVVVQAQETWTLRTEFSYSRASADNERWNVLLADDNFLGHGAQVGLGTGQTEDEHYTFLSLSKRRLIGSRWQVDLSSTDRGDGYAHYVGLSRPFYALDDDWGLEVRGWSSSSSPRFYVSNAGPAGVDPAAARLYVRIPVRNVEASLVWQRRTGTRGRGRVWRWGFGLDVRDLDFDLEARGLGFSDGRPADPATLSVRGSALARADGVTVQPFLVLTSEGRRWTTSRYVLNYGAVEDLNLEPTLQVLVGPTGPAFGSTAGDGNRLQGSLGVRDWSRLGAGFLLLEGELEGVIGREEESELQALARAGWLGRHGSERWPWLTRIFVEGGYGSRILGTDAFVLGLNRGLRTLEFDGMAGDRLLRWNVEQGLLSPLEPLGLYRTGLAVFYGGGLAWWDGEDRNLGDARHEVGCGLRFGAIRSARGEVARLDLTWSLDGGGPVVTAVTHGLF